MPYQQTTLAQFITQISIVLDDVNQVYWTAPEITYATQEALRVWGALTNFWRSRGTFNLTPSDPYPFYDLSVKLPALRPRTWTLNQLTQEIQYALLENPSGIGGAGMSGQISVTTILNAIQDARNRFVLDVHFPVSVVEGFGLPPSPGGMVTFDQGTVFVHKASWQDIEGGNNPGVWANLWREDAWSSDKYNPLWTLDPGMPQSYSEAENAPLQLQLIPPPINKGALEALAVNSLVMSLGTSTTLLEVPDEWVPAIKYAALSRILSSDNQIKDPLRAQYAEMRYQQLVKFAQDARTIMRVLINNKPLPLDSMMSIDAANLYWRNQIGQPSVAGALYDFMSINVGQVDQLYGIAVDVVQAAPIPTALNAFMPIGEEQLDILGSYVTHILTFKCGGNEFKTTMSEHDEFLKAAAQRGSINAAKIRYLEPLFGQPQVETAQRPDALEMKSA